MTTRDCGAENLVPSAVSEKAPDRSMRYTVPARRPPDRRKRPASAATEHRPLVEASSSTIIRQTQKAALVRTARAGQLRTARKTVGVMSPRTELRRQGRRRMAAPVQALSARVVFELLDQMGRHYDMTNDVDGRLEGYAALDTNVLRAIRADRLRRRR